MATALNARARVAGGAVAVLAIGFITAMAFTGGPRENQQRVRFEAAGLMKETPREVDRVELDVGGRRLALVRRPTGWSIEDGSGSVPERRKVAPELLAGHLETSLQFMHVAAPVRTLERAEWQRTALEEFGLAPPRYVVRLSARGRVLLSTRFGVTNPQEVLQYAQVDGRDDLYLLPRFIGQEWERLLESAPTR